MSISQKKKCGPLIVRFIVWFVVFKSHIPSSFYLLLITLQYVEMAFIFIFVQESVIVIRGGLVLHKLWMRKMCHWFIILLYVIMKMFRHTEKLKGVYREHIYAHNLDFTINILLHLCHYTSVYLFIIVSLHQSFFFFNTFSINCNHQCTSLL